MQEFAEEILKRVRDKAEGAFSVWLSKSVKNNGGVRIGLSMDSPLDELPKAHISMESYWKEYDSGRIDVEEAAESMYQILRNAQRHQPQWKVEDLFNWEKILPHLRMMLVNTEKNKKWLKKAPCRPFLDLSILYYISVPDQKQSMGLIRIWNECLSWWKVDEEMLYQAARKNMKASGETCFYEIQTFLRTAGVLEGNRNIPFNSPLFALSNHDQSFGAAELLNEETLENIYDQIGVFAILPSSLHEVLIVPNSVEIDYTQLANIVKEVNHTTILPEDYLSDHVYMYDKQDGGLRIAI